MLLNLKEAATKDVPVHLNGRIDLSGLLGARQDVTSFGTAVAELEAWPSGGDVTVHGTISFDLVQSCARCLEPVKQHLAIPFQETFTLSAKAAESDEDLIFAQDDKVELVPYLEEAVQLGIPYIPLCNEDCKGLCPTCGTNQNAQPCDCKQEKIDPRLAGLADFFKEQ